MRGVKAERYRGKAKELKEKERAGWRWRRVEEAQAGGLFPEFEALQVKEGLQMGKRGQRVEGKCAINIISFFPLC